MPNIKSAKKRLKQSLVRRDKNRSVKSALRTFLKKAETALEAGDKTVAEAAVKDACSHLDKTARKNIIHDNAASRRKSRLMKKLQKIS